MAPARASKPFVSSRIVVGRLAALLVVAGFACSNGHDPPRSAASVPAPLSSTTTVVPVSIRAEYTCGATDGIVIAVRAHSSHRVRVVAELIVGTSVRARSEPTSLDPAGDEYVEIDLGNVGDLPHRGTVRLVTADGSTSSPLVLASTPVVLSLPQGFGCG